MCRSALPKRPSRSVGIAGHEKQQRISGTI
jgi:hypothetical protein